MLDGEQSSADVRDRNSFAEHLLGSAVNRDTGHVCHVTDLTVSEKEVNKCSGTETRRFRREARSEAARQHRAGSGPTAGGVGGGPSEGPVLA